MTVMTHNLLASGISVYDQYRGKFWPKKTVNLPAAIPAVRDTDTVITENDMRGWLLLHSKRDFRGLSV
jgi:hypothetical protein